MAQIPLRARDGSIRAYALVDDADFDWLSQWTWRLSAYGYAVRGEHPPGGAYRTVFMAREVLGLAHGDPRQGDHEGRDRLDNRRSKLRIAPRAHKDNGQNKGLQPNNTSGYRGVCWDKRRGCWMARAKIDRRAVHLGYFDTAEAAGAVASAFRAEHMPFSEDARAA